VSTSSCPRRPVSGPACCRGSRHLSAVLVPFPCRRCSGVSSLSWSWCWAGWHSAVASILVDVSASGGGGRVIWAQCLCRGVQWHWLLCGAMLGGAWLDGRAALCVGWLGVCGAGPDGGSRRGGVGQQGWSAAVCADLRGLACLCRRCVWGGVLVARGRVGAASGLRWRGWCCRPDMGGG